MNMKIGVPAKNKNTLYWVIFGLVIVIFLANYYYINRANDTQAKTTYLLPQNNDKNNNDNNVAVLGQSDTKTADGTQDAPVFLSENFKVSQISLDNNLSNVSVADFEESSILKVSDIKSELYSVKEGEKDVVKALITCSTSKRSNVEVEYYKSGEKTPTVIKDNYYGLGHMIIISGLDPDSVYKYLVKASDLNNNNVSSEQFVFYTGAPNVSLMAVLENATQKVFGWAMKK